MGLYDLHKYLYALADDLNTENQKRLERLISATRNSQYFSYVSENLNTPPRFDENIGLADPSENRAKRYANFRAPQKLPPRHDVRRYEMESNLDSNRKQPSYYRKADINTLPDSVLANLNRHTASDFKNKVKSCLLKKNNDETIVISKESYVGNQPVSVFTREIKVSKDDSDYNLLNSVWQKGAITNIKISMPLRPLDKTESLGFEVNSHFYGLVKKARRNEKNI